MTGGIGADAVLECVGTNDSMLQAFGSARPGSTVGFVGVPHGVELPLRKMFGKNVGLAGGVAPVRKYLPELLDLVTSGTVDPGLVFDSRMPLDKVAEGYARHGRAARDQGLPRRLTRALLPPEVRRWSSSERQRAANQGGRAASASERPTRWSSGERGRAANQVVEQRARASGQPGGRAASASERPTRWSSSERQRAANQVVEQRAPASGQPGGRAASASERPTRWSSGERGRAANQVVEQRAPASGQPGGRAASASERPVETTDRDRAAYDRTGKTGGVVVWSRPQTTYVSSAGGSGAGARCRCIQSTSCQAPNFQPMRRQVPIGSNPRARCSPSLAGLGRVIPATAVR